MHNKKTQIGIYCEYFLTNSMTFIFRQLIGAQKKFNPIVITQDTNNLDVFPYHKIYVRKKKRWERLYSKFYRIILNKYRALSPKQNRYFEKIIKQNNIKFIHAHFGPSGLDILPLAKKNNIPLLVTFHGYDASELLKNKKYLKDINQLFKYAKIVCISRNMADRLVDYGANNKNISVHYIGIPINRFPFFERKPISEKLKSNLELNFLQVSNFVEKKGHYYTIKAFNKFLPNYRKSKLVLAGDGPLKEKMINFVSELGLSDHVIFLGNVSTEYVSKLMEKSDIFLHHSITSKSGDMEGIPTVLMEAMSSGLVVISTYHSGIPELVENNVNGFLVPEKNVDAYVNVLNKIVTTDISHINRNAHKTIENDFNIHKQNNKLIQIYDNCMQNI